MKFAQRIGGNDFLTQKTAYKFGRIKEGIRKFQAEHSERELLDFGVGEPDRAAGEIACGILSKECGSPENRFYADNGISEFQFAAARFMQNIFGIRVDDPEKQIIHGIGSKSILAMLPMAFTDPSDVCLTTVPGYGILAQNAKYLGAKIVNLPLRQEFDFLPDLDSIDPVDIKQASILYLNYPNNPTGRGPDPVFFLRAVEFCRKNEILLVHDAAYAALNYSYANPFSVFSIPGAWECAIEVHSLSKSFNMTGWRLGFALGNPDLIKAYGEIKINFDCGQFRAIQKSGAAVLDDARRIIDSNRDRYLLRRSAMDNIFRRMNWKVRTPDAGYYFYAPVPIGITAAEAATRLLEDHGIVTIPWNEAGEFLRISLSFDASQKPEKNILNKFEDRLNRFFQSLN